MSLGREFTITYRDHLEANERVVEGAFWNGPSAEPEVSVERQIAERARIHVGDTMRFDILGRIVSRARDEHPRRRVARVAQRRLRVRVPARRARPGAADLRRAAQGTGTAPSARARFQHDLVEQFPNVSVIDFHEMLETLRDVMSKVTLAITVVGGLVLFSGALILIGAVAMTKFQRVYEAAVFKTLGANTRTIARMLLFEYGVLGSLAGLIGSLGAVVLTWGVSRYALEIPWRVFAGEHIGGVVAHGACSSPSSASSRASTCSGTSRSRRCAPSSGSSSPCDASRGRASCRCSPSVSSRRAVHALSWLRQCASNRWCMI